jgi:hypothetical protein
MPLQDLTPQLRTRLSRLERWVGIFVSVATLLVLVGLIFYIRQMARDKGWYMRKLPYYTFVDNAAGLKVGDKVKMMGFEIGEITKIVAQPPEDSYYNVFVSFIVREPHDGYLWEDSRAKVGAGDFLGNRAIEVTKGTNGAPSYVLHDVREASIAEAQQYVGSTSVFIGQEVYDESGTNRLAKPGQTVTAELLRRFEAGGVGRFQVFDKAANFKFPKYIWSFKAGRYIPFDRKDPEISKGYFLPPNESPALTERLDQVINQVQTAIPNFLALTNRLNEVLAQAARATATADDLLAGARPLVNNLTVISANLTNGRGSLGEWILPTNLNTQLSGTLTNASRTLASANLMLTNTDARIVELATSLNRALEELAGITSNLHHQVDANTNILSDLSKLVVDTDHMIQGLKHHWLLRSAFKEKATNAPPQATSRKAVSPKDGGR